MLHHRVGVAAMAQEVAASWERVGLHTDWVTDCRGLQEAFQGALRREDHHRDWELPVLQEEEPVASPELESVFVPEPRKQQTDRQLQRVREEREHHNREPVVAAGEERGADRTYPWDSPAVVAVPSCPCPCPWNPLAKAVPSFPSMVVAVDVAVVPGTNS